MTNPRLGSYVLAAKILHAPLFFFTSAVAGLRRTARPALSHTHSQAFQAEALFAATFSDSGHWDFVVQAALEAMSRKFLIATLGPATEQSVVEKAGWAAANLLTSLSVSSFKPAARGFLLVGEVLGWGSFWLFLSLGVASFAAYL